MFERVTIKTKDIIAGEMLKSLLKRIRRHAEIKKPEASIQTEDESVASLEKSEFPDGPDEIAGTEYLGGSSGVMAGYFRDKLLVIKKARKPDGEETGQENTQQLADEYIADRIYEVMGVNVPTSRIYSGGTHKISKFIPGKDLNTFSKDQPEFQFIKEELRGGFVLDCLLANWDVIGTAGGDNIRLGYDGRVYRLDNGGALRFRARGAKKGDGFGERVSELYSLRTKSELFADISDEEIEKQIEEILKNSDKILGVIDSSATIAGLPAESIAELKSIIEKRLTYLKNFKKSKKKKMEAKTDKGVYESVATNNYFEGWDEDVELEGNPEIKEQIRQNILRAEKTNQEIYEHAAADLGVSVEEFKARLQTKIEDMVERANFFRATQFGVLEKIMNVDGRWKNQFETGTSQGMLSPGYRAVEEMRMFGFNKTEGLEVPTDTTEYAYGDKKFPDWVLEKDKERRPIYGYFSDEEHGAINYKGKIPPPYQCISIWNRQF